MKLGLPHIRPCFLVADTQLYKSLCPSVRRSIRRSVGPSVNTSRNVWKRAFPPLPTRPQLELAVYPALLNRWFKSLKLNTWAWTLSFKKREKDDCYKCFKVRRLCLLNQFALEWKNERVEFLDERNTECLTNQMNKEMNDQVWRKE